MPACCPTAVGTCPTSASCRWTESRPWWTVISCCESAAYPWAPCPLDPLVIDRDGKRLVVRLIRQPSGDPYLLLAEQELASPRVLERLGLSRRRGEVLFWVAQGKTDEEVARIIDCTVGTAKKHLQRIFEQLGVGNRHLATLRALEILGLPDKAGL
jgi:DNA-binding CsgD family transcriptional regulator